MEELNSYCKKCKDWVQQEIIEKYYCPSKYIAGANEVKCKCLSCGTERLESY